LYLSTQNVLEPLIYLICTADLRTSTESTSTTLALDTSVLATDSDPATASQKLQTNLDAIQKWLKRWRINTNKSKSVQVTFTTRGETCPPVHIYNLNLLTHKMSSISGYTSTRDLPGANTYSRNGSNWESSILERIPIIFSVFFILKIFIIE
jgi:hypothetical protein